MFTAQQQRFQDLAETLLDHAATADSSDAQRVALAASRAADMAKLAAFPDVPDRHLQRAFDALNKPAPEWADLTTANTCASLISQHLNAADQDKERAGTPCTPS